MGVLAAACLLVGLVPGIALQLALPVAGLLTGANDPRDAVPVGLDSTAPLGPFGALVLVGVAGVWTLRAVLGGSRRRVAPTWGCAYSRPTARMQYNAASFSSPLLAAFPLPAGPGRAHLQERDGSSPSDRIMRGVALPLWKKVQTLALSVRSLQRGRVTTYLQYMIWTVLMLLGFLIFASMGGRS